jgi:hypothetical protein
MKSRYGKFKPLARLRLKSRRGSHDSLNFSFPLPNGSQIAMQERRIIKQKKFKVVLHSHPLAVLPPLYAASA